MWGSTSSPANRSSSAEGWDFKPLLVGPVGAGSPSTPGVMESGELMRGAGTKGDDVTQAGGPNGTEAVRAGVKLGTNGNVSPPKKGLGDKAEIDETVWESGGCTKCSSP